MKRGELKVIFKLNPIRIIAIMILAVLMLSCASFSYCYAATYYVDAQNGSDSNSGTSPDNAWRTIQKINNSILLPGDIVLLKRGCVWQESLQIYHPGDIDNPISFGAYGAGEKPVFDGAGSIYFPLLISTTHHILVNDLTVRNGIFPVLINNSHRITVDNLTVHDNAGQGIYILAQEGGKCEYNAVKNCTVFNTAALDQYNMGSGILIYGEESKHHLIENNIVYNSSHEGIVIFQGSDNRIANNEVHHSVGSGIRVAGRSASNNLIEDNISHENAQNNDDRYGIDLIIAGDNNTVRYNMVYRQKNTLADDSIGPDPGNCAVGGEFCQKYGTGGIRFDGGGGGEIGDHTYSNGNIAYGNVIFDEYTGIDVFNFDNVQLYHNTIYNSADSNSAPSRNCRSIGIAIVSSNQEKPIARTIAMNNIVYTKEAAAFVASVSNAVDCSLDYNLYYQDGDEKFLFGWSQNNFAAWRSLTGQDTHSLAGNPVFQNEITYDLQLQASSPAIDAGTPIEGIEEDFKGVPRPQGELYDIGAYEYASAITLGDVDGNEDISAFDAALAARVAVGLDISGLIQQGHSQALQAADADSNGSVDAYDAALIARMAVGL